MIDAVLKDFGLNKEAVSILPLWQGLINRTWKISLNGHSYVLQKINQQVFKKPEDIAHNISLIAGYLQKYEPGYRFVSPIQTIDGKSLIYKKEEGYYRAFPFVPGSHSKEVVQNPVQAYEAAAQFGMFTKLLKGFDVTNLKITISSFHDLSLRYQQFLEALEKGNPERLLKARIIIKELASRAYIVEEFERIKKNPEFKLRVTHHDTKISNVLFDKDDNGLCVIDLDTVMPGYFFSDVGDMMRTYLSPVSEEETDFSKIEIRDEFYKAVVRGYYNEMKDELTEAEKKYFFYAGTFMIYMQALRFLTDYLNNDIYYGSKYPEHNLNRVMNQVALLKRLYEKQELFEKITLTEIRQ
jgi:Ser/Thr protein kinase RdoA (MazF antagonist)